MRFIEKKLFPERRFVKAGAIDEILAVLGKWGVIVFVIGIIVAVFFLNIKPKLDANGYISDLQTILQGLNTYYSGYHKYPKGSGWTWNTNNAYISPDIVNKGWQYSCQDSTIKITTPAIASDKVRTLVQGGFSSICDSVTVSGDKVVCQLNNRPCW